MTEYAERDPEELDEGGHYCKHLMAMTAEDLHSKRDIACELAYRDKRIAELEQDLREMDAENDRLSTERFNEGMERAAKITDKWELGKNAAEAIRKEIDK